MIRIDLTPTAGGPAVKTLKMPESWDEMSASQVQYIFQQYERLAKGELTRRQFEVLAVYRLIGLQRGPSRSAAVSSSIVENISKLCELISYIYYSTPEDGTVPQLSFRSIQNPLQSVKCGGRSLCGPSTLGQDLTFGEFRSAAMALNTFFETEDPAALDECIAHLYRPRSMNPNKAGRKVRPVRVDTFEDDVKVVSAMLPWQKNLIMLWFASCINFLQTEKLTLGGEVVDLGLLFSGGEESDGQKTTWNDLLLQIAREGTIGNMDAVDEAPLMTIILHMWSNYKENQRNERNIKKAKKD